MSYLLLVAIVHAGAFDAVVCWHHARGGEGAVDLGRALAAACEQPANFRFLYPLDLSIKARARRHKSAPALSSLPATALRPP